MLLWLFFLPILLSHALYTAVPPSSNPKSKVHKEFLHQIQSNFELKREPQIGRVWFDLPKDSETCSSNISINQINARSIRIVSLQTTTLGENDDELSVVSLLSANLKRDLDTALENWKKMGNILPEHNESISFSLNCQMWNDCIVSISRTKLCQILAKRIHQEFKWTRLPKSGNPTLRMNVLVYESSVILELVSLIRPIGTNELPKPGFKRVESFALCQSANIEPNDIVLDPMCGKATFLVEAATIWPHASKFQGIDCSTEQLEDAQENINASGFKNIELLLGDARHLPYDDSSIDKIISCPPFGRQFEKISFQELIKEWSRVLKDNGRMALLLDAANIDPFIEATEMTNTCQVEYCRSPYFKLGRIRASILIVSKQSARRSIKKGKLSWEQGHSESGRPLWATLRSQALPSLVPYSIVTTQ